MLFLDSPPQESLPIPHFRTASDKPVVRPSVDLLDTITTMLRRQDWMRERSIEGGSPPLKYVGSARISESITAVASRMRALLGFASSWAESQSTWEDSLREMRDAIDSAGIMVVVNGVVGNNTSRPLNPEEFRGFVLSDEYAPLVFVNGRDAKSAQMFTLAHELAHVFFGSSAAFDLREMAPASDPIEIACNRIAAEFLVPEASLRSVWSTLRDGMTERIYRLSKQFKVSAIVVARRALDLKLIDRNAFMQFYLAHITAERTAKPGGGNFYSNQEPRIGRRFGAAVVRAAREGKILYTEAYALTGLGRGVFEKYAAGIEV